MHHANPIALASLLAIIPMSAQSQEATVSESQHAYVLDLGAGVQYQPKYPGSNDYILFPLPIIAVQRFFLPGFGQVVGGEEKLRAFYMYPSFDFNGERKASDSNELAGTETVDWALELGVGLGYRYDWLRGTVEVRQGINGHDGQVIDLPSPIMRKVKIRER